MAAVGDKYVLPGFLKTSTNTTFLSKATNYFSHMLQQRWEAKIHQKESSPQSGIELTTTRSWVRHAHHWATRVGQFFIQTSLIKLMNGFQGNFTAMFLGRTIIRYLKEICFPWWPWNRSSEPSRLCGIILMSKNFNHNSNEAKILTNFHEYQAGPTNHRNTTETPKYRYFLAI